MTPKLPQRNPSNFPMQIEPPKPDTMDTGRLRHRLGYMTTFLIGFAVLLLVTLVAWFMLWGGGVKRASQVDSPAPASVPASRTE